MRNGRNNRVNLLDNNTDSSDEDIAGARNINVGDYIDNHYTGNIVTQERGNDVPNIVPAIPHSTRSGIRQADDDDDDNNCLGYVIHPQFGDNFNTMPDRYNYTYLIFYLLGATTMAPWNFYVTAEDYWMFKFRNITDHVTDLTPMQKSFTSDLTVTAALSGTLFLILNAVYGHLFALKYKMIGTMVIILMLFIVTVGFVEIDTDHWQAEFFMLTLGIVVIINVCAAIMSGALFGIAGLFPSEYMTAVVSGQALGGISTALAFILALTFGASPKTTAFVYFSIGNGLMVISILTYIIMSRTAFFRYHVYEKTNPSSSILENDAGLVMVPDIKIVFGKIYLYALIEVLVFTASLSVYPAVTVLTQSENHGNGHPWNDVYFMPVVNYLAFNSGDYMGRILAGLWQVPKNNPHLCLMLTLLRFGFIPCFMLSNTSHIFLPTFITSDSTFITLIILFAISNGYLANIPLISVPQIVMQHERELASSIMAAALSLGLTIGACCSMFIVQIL